MRHSKNKKIYFWGLLCLVPLVGIFVGIALIYKGAFRLKDRTLILIGCGGILFTLLFYSYLYYNLALSKEAHSRIADLSQTKLNTLVRDIEFYKLQNGVYPDEIRQITSVDKFAPLIDPLAQNRGDEECLFFYKKIGEKYVLYSFGIDGIRDNEDDIFPVYSEINIQKFGFVSKQEYLLLHNYILSKP